MGNPSIGIGDLKVYTPESGISSQVIVDTRGKDDPELKRRLFRATEYTGQKFVHFPETWEDASTMAAEAAYRLLKANPGLDVSALRYIACGTETTVDHSKPISAYVQGMLCKAGLTIPESLSTFQVQHACAGGTLSLLSIGALLSLSPKTEESGLVLCTDIARYNASTTAEITQGAGSVAILVEKSPRLVELDLVTAGYASRDVDDFFRPLGSTIAKVKGRFSIRCYREALESAFLDHCRRLGEEPADVLRATDLFVLHVPYYSLPMESLRVLLRKYLGLNHDEAEEFLAERGFQSSIEPAGLIGNLYSGSMFMALTFLLSERYKQFGEKIVGKRVLLGSYGSGNTMAVVSGKIAASAPSVIDKWDLSTVLSRKHEVPFEEYDNWMKGTHKDDSYNDYIQQQQDKISDGAFYLNSIREDGYREYLVKS